MRVWTCAGVRPRSRAIRGACKLAYAGLMSGSRPLALAVTASDGTTGSAGAVPRIGVITPPSAT